MTDGASITAIAASLQARSPRRLALDTLRQASVLIPLRVVNRSIEVVLTLRSTRLASHAGQVSFPGGRHEPTDVDTWATAVRETHEELGIPPRALRPVGELDHVPTPSGYLVIPWVAELRPDVATIPDPREVARVLRVPLRDLMNLERWTPEWRDREGLRIKTWRFDLGAEVIWGVTGTILRGFVDRLPKC